MSKKTKYVIGIDIGTTSVRSLVYDERGEVVGEAHSSLDPVIPHPGCYEIDPDQLWEKVIYSKIWNKRIKSINHIFAICIYLFDQLFVFKVHLKYYFLSYFPISPNFHIVSDMFCDERMHEESRSGVIRYQQSGSLVSESHLHHLVCSDWGTLSQPYHMEGYESWQVLSRVEQELDNESTQVIMRWWSWDGDPSHHNDWKLI